SVFLHVEDDCDLMVPSISVAMMYVIEVGCLLLSVLGVFGACKGKRWSLLVCLQKRVVREESKLLAMMPLTTPNKANRTLLHNIQEELECCGLIEGYKDWGASIPASCNCHYPGKCVMENNIDNTQINILFTPAAAAAALSFYVAALLSSLQPCLPIYLSELKLAFSLVMAIQFGSGVFWVSPASITFTCTVKRLLPYLAFNRWLLESNVIFFFLVCDVCFCPQIILLGMSIKLMGQIKRKQEFIALLQSNRYVPGAF
uniref:Uncharacterized protein n=1 Tax=Fundulus heteroclitus TaxID=8078 RepID=A0A3Q2QG16_FUNHE